MSHSYQIVVCGSIVPDPLQLLGFHAKTQRREAGSPLRLGGFA
jgi:hypothetical protein